MKRCEKCDITYGDSDYNFCQKCGGSLIVVRNNIKNKILLGLGIFWAIGAIAVFPDPLGSIFYLILSIIHLFFCRNFIIELFGRLTRKKTKAISNPNNYQQQFKNVIPTFLGIGIFCLLGTFVMPFAGEKIVDKILGTLFFLGSSIVCLGICIYDYWYFKSPKFHNTKSKIENYIKECNELNTHIEELKKSYETFDKTDYGKAQFYDNSNYNYKKSEFKNYQNSQYIYNCSATVCNGAKNQPFKYLCKYFNIDITEQNLEKFETVFNNFSSAEQGKILLKNERDKILNSIDNEVPFIIKKIDYNRFVNELGFKPIDFHKLYFPKYSFVYISNGGNSSTRCDIVLDLENLEKFINFLSSQIEFKKSIIGQRALMTSALRMKIKERDNYTCQQCKNSIKEEPNLLLEIDHIMPLSKGGITSEENLQTLCWKCNRSKGSKIF